ncbi:MAG: diaminopimelate decarboxylase [Armatimonadetes bacterium]|jgi:diaminopimelate decarboxylase|nr:diaminopimelate decarboxylase [Armatimonadota bacterium]
MMLLGTQRVNGAGHLEIGGVDVTALAAEYGTPLYVMDEATIRQKAREYLAAFRARYPKVEVSFAGKAFLCSGICKLIEQEGLRLDVASGGELFTALRAGFPTERISLHGNNKSREEVQMALDARVGHIVVDNFYEIDLLTELATDAARPQPVLIRVAPGIDPHTHRRISTGQVDTKFGFDIASGGALTAISRIREIAGLELKGIHCHVGSQLLDTECHEASVGIMADLLVQVKRDFGIEFEELNIGGGLGIRYLSTHQPPSVEEFADTVTGILKRKLDEAGLAYPILLQEPGRYLVGEAGTTLYTLGSIKHVPGIRTYVSVDGGLSDNPRPALYEAKYEAIVANKADQPHDRVVTVSGKHCETDLLFPDISLAPVEPGDILAVQSTGAYNYVMASNYNRFRRPPVVLVNDGQADLLVRRESYEDLVAQDVVPERFR